MAQMHGSGLKYLRNGFTMLEMGEESDKRLKYVENEVYMWEMTQVFQKRLKYVENDVDLWEMARIYGIFFFFFLSNTDYFCALL